MPRMPAGCVAGALVMLLPACASRGAHVDGVPADTTRIDHALLMPPGQARYEMDDLALFVMPMELDSPPPAFPAGVVAGDMAPLTVCVEAWLDAAGDVARVAPARGVAGCPRQGDARIEAFEAAVTEAMRGWVFSSAAICRFPERLRAQRDRGDCTGSDVELTRVPVRLTYAFTFERHAGREQVASARLPAASAEAGP